MASFLRLLTRNTITKLGPVNSVFESKNVAVQQRHNSMFLSHIEDLMTKRDNFQGDKTNLEKFENLKHNIEMIKPDNKIINSTSSGSDFLNMIYASKTDNDIDAIVKFLQINKKKVSSVRYYSSSLMNLFYILKKPNRAKELFNDKDIGELFFNRTCVTVLTYHLDEIEDYKGVCDVYEKFFAYIENCTKIGMGQRPDSLLNEQVTMWTKAQYNLNSHESMLQMKGIFQKFLENQYNFSSASLIHLTLLAINHGEAEYALEVIETTISQRQGSNRNLKTNEVITENLKAILLANMNRHDEAIEMVKGLIKKFSIDQNRFVVFPKTLEFIEKSCRDNTHKMTALYSDIKGRLFSMNWDLVPFGEHLTKLGMKNKYEIIRKNQVETVKENRVQSNTQIVSMASSLPDSEKIDSQIRKLEFLLAKLDEKLLLLDNKNLLLDNENSSQIQSIFPIKEYNSLIEEIRSLYKQKAYTPIIEKCCNFLIKADPRSEAQPLVQKEFLSILGFSIAKDRNIESSQVKRIIELMTKKWNFKLDARLQFLIAHKLIKLDPLYLLEFLAAMDESDGMLKHHLSLYKNILAIGLSMIGKVDIALDQIDSVLSTDLSNDENSFEGKVFQNTVDVLKKVIAKSEDNVSRNRFENIVIILNSNTKRLMKQNTETIDSRILLNRNNTKTLKTSRIFKSDKKSTEHQTITTEPKSRPTKVVQKKKQNLPENDQERVVSNYNKENHSAVIEICENILLNRDPTVENLSDRMINMYAGSLLKHESLNFKKLQTSIDLVKSKWNKNFSTSMQNRIYFQLLKFNPTYAFDFVSNHLQDLENKMPSVHKNLMIMGMCSVGKNEDALKLSELILETSMITSRSFETQKKWIKVDDSYFQGRLYKQTIDTLKEGLSMSTDTSHKHRLEKILQSLKNEPDRVISYDPLKVNFRIQL